MAVDIRENKPWSKNQIQNTKNNIPRSDSILSGYIAGSMNGGHNKVIAWKQVMAGEKHKEYKLQCNFKLLTPKTPTYQNLYMTIRTYFVPNSRIWDNAEKYTAQKGGTAEIKIKEIPNLGNHSLPTIDDGFSTEFISLSNTTAWRDTYISSYLPRIGNFEKAQNDIDVFTNLPAVSVLPLRGRKAIYNDFERNKEYDAEIYEFKDDNVSSEEWNTYLPTTKEKYILNSMRAKKPDSYFSNYRTELQGFEEEYPPEEMSSDAALINWASWEMKIAEARSQAENAQLNDWDIIAKIRGSKKLTEGKVQLLSEKTFNLNYAAVTQNAYNNNENIKEEFRTLGEQGAYSFTNINLPLYAGIEFKEEGYIHIIATISADSVYETAFDRLELNVTPLDQYRPDMLEDKKDVLYKSEMGTENFENVNEYNQVVGFKRKYSEYFKLPNIITGDMTSNNYSQIKVEPGTNNDFCFGTTVETQKTFQFFETSAETFPEDNVGNSKNIWQDYTDYLIDKNQAIKNEKFFFEGLNDFILKGQNQCFFVGKCICIAELPIEDSIKDNYTQWGEH